MFRTIRSRRVSFLPVSGVLYILELVPSILCLIVVKRSAETFVLIASISLAEVTRGDAFCEACCQGERLRTLGTLTFCGGLC